MCWSYCNTGLISRTEVRDLAHSGGESGPQTTDHGPRTTDNETTGHGTKGRGLGREGLRIAGAGKMRENKDMSIAELPIRIDREKVAAFCRARGIRKLSLFGSVLREDFDPERSDVDVLAEFEPGVRPGSKFFRYGDELAESVLSCLRFNAGNRLE